MPSKTTAPEPISPRARRAAWWWLGGFMVSTYLLSTASLPGFVANTVTRVLDIGLILILVAITVWLQSKTTSHISLNSLWRAYGVAALLPALVLVGIWQYSANLDLEVFIPGIAWRLWLLLYTLPHLLAALRPSESTSD